MAVPTHTTDFPTLKSEIISLATALYGTYSTTPSPAFDLLSYTTPTSPSPDETENSTISVALIVYTGPASAPFTAWEMLSYVEDQASLRAGAEKILEDLRKGVGDVIRKF